MFLYITKYKHLRAQSEKISKFEYTARILWILVGNDMPVEKKIKAINEVIVDKYQVKYSTIVVFDGTDYVIKATNVNERHWKALSRLHEVEIFKDSITTASPKYITVNNDNEKLPYQENEFDRAKSAIFFPLYIDNVYIGYWIIESSMPHDFDNIDTTIFETVKENIITVLKTIGLPKNTRKYSKKRPIYRAKFSRISIWRRKEDNRPIYNFCYMYV